MIKSPLITVAAFVVLTFCPTSTSGDTLSGFVHFDGITTFFSGSFDMLFSGTSSNGTTFSAFLIGSSISGIQAPRLLANEHGGTSFNLGSSASLDMGDFGGFGVTINGISYQPSGLDLVITSNVVTIPFTTDPTITLYAPCLVNLGVFGRGGGGAGAHGTCDARLTLAKTGTDSLGFGTYSSESVFYGLASAPVPEPATFVLLGAGLVVIAATVRKQRKGSRARS